MNNACKQVFLLRPSIVPPSSPEIRLSCSLPCTTLHPPKTNNKKTERQPNTPDLHEHVERAAALLLYAAVRLVPVHRVDGELHEPELDERLATVLAVVGQVVRDAQATLLHTCVVHVVE